MDFFAFAAKWFWAISITAVLANVAIIRSRTQGHIRENPDLAAGYTTITRGLAIWGNIPWVVMGIGCVFGGVPSVFHFFRPRECNPFVILFFVSVILIWIRGTFWLFFRGGAEILVKHPGVFNMDFKNPIMIKLLWCLSVVAGIGAAVAMLTQDIPLPRFME